MIEELIGDDKSQRRRYRENSDDRAREREIERIVMIEPDKEI